ncbi:citrate synthase/methylcitrate synthase [Hyphomonas oceanitis]|uniref:citrate synthase/methylcitrate synthase n=1 Tax=Hyphomonas oceanitis TaxID=81033 RepID=UPI003002C632
MSQGLDDVIAAETRLSSVDGARGVLVVKGFSLDRLAGQKRFEDVAHLLFEGLLDDLPDAKAFAARLGAAREAVYPLAQYIDDALLALPPMDGVRALTARIEDGEDVATALRLLAAPAVLLPAFLRRRRGLAPIAPDAKSGHAADMLHMLTGEVPAPEVAAALDTYLVTVADHGLNASTFAARVVSSTWSGLTSSVLAGLAALKGPLHGGAPGPIIAMLDGIGKPENAESWIEDALDRGDRLMGFGHRIYKVRDPRADALKAAVKRMSADSSALPGRLKLAEAVERAALKVLHKRKPDRPLDVNVEFYTALLLEALGFPPDAFTAVFATGRTAGWLAHAREQRLTGRLIRPQSVYVGPEPAELV